MKQTLVKMKVKDILDLYNNKKINFFFKSYDNSIVSRKNIWTTKDKSMYIYSLLKNYLTYPFSFVQKYSDNETILYDIIDGKQRVWAICEFILNTYMLDEDVPNIDKIKLRNLLFCNLPVALQNKLLNYSLTIYIENENISENLESYMCYNGGISLKPIELFKAKLGKNMDLLEKIVNHKVFSIFNISSKNQIQQYEMALYILMLETNPSIGLAKKNKEAFVNKLSILKKFDDIIINNALTHLDYLYSAFYNKEYLSIPKDNDKYLKKSHIIILYQLIDLAIKKGITSHNFFDWSYEFFVKNKDIDNNYWVESSRGSTTAKSSMDIRYRELYKNFENYFGGLAVIPFKLKA